MPGVYLEFEQGTTSTLNKKTLRNKNGHRKNMGKKGKNGDDLMLEDHGDDDDDDDGDDDANGR